MASVSALEIILADQAAVWALLSDIANANRWNKAWQQVEFTSNQTHGVGTGFKAHTENGDVFEFEITSWSAPEHLEVKPVRSPDEARYPVMLDSHEFRLSPADNGAHTALELRANATAHGIKGWLIAWLIWPGHQRDGLRTALDSIAAAFGNGNESMEPGDTPPPLSS